MQKLTMNDIGELIGKTPAAVRGMKLRNELPPHDDKFGKSPLWKTSTINKWLAARKRRG